MQILQTIAIFQKDTETHNIHGQHCGLANYRILALTITSYCYSTTYLHSFSPEEPIKNKFVYWQNVLSGYKQTLEFCSMFELATYVLRIVVYQKQVSQHPTEFASSDSNLLQLFCQAEISRQKLFTLYKVVPVNICSRKKQTHLNVSKFIFGRIKKCP